jgi:uncharacterized membrane protein
MPMTINQHPANIQRFENNTFFERLPDALTDAIGKLSFIAWASVVVVVWILWNTLTPWPFDPFPFVFLNLAFSAFAFYSAPLILMSQNRQSEHDRARAEEDLKTDKRTLAIQEQIAQHFDIDISDIE